MTNEEAREILKRVEIAKPIKFEDYADMREALDMAIEALQPQPSDVRPIIQDTMEISINGEKYEIPVKKIKGTLNAETGQLEVYK